MTTIHSYTNDQVLTDVYHKDLRRARSATQSMIPTKTGAAAAVGLVLPELDGKLDGFAVRVPTINVSLVDLTFNAARATTVDEINALLKAASDGELPGVLGYNDGPLVSIDFNHNPLSSIYDATLTKVLGGTLVKVCSWYDNEWGFSNRMLDTTLAMVKAALRPAAARAEVPACEYCGCRTSTCAGKRVMIRVDLNVPLQDGKVVSDARIRASLPSIRMAVEAGAAVIMLSHLGRPKEGQFDPQFSLAPVAEHLAVLLGRPVALAQDWLDELQIRPGRGCAVRERAL